MNVEDVVVDPEGKELFKGTPEQVVKWIFENDRGFANRVVREGRDRKVPTDDYLGRIEIVDSNGRRMVSGRAHLIERWLRYRLREVDSHRVRNGFVFIDKGNFKVAARGWIKGGDYSFPGENRQGLTPEQLGEVMSPEEKFSATKKLIAELLTISRDASPDREAIQAMADVATRTIFEEII